MLQGRRIIDKDIRKRELFDHLATTAIAEIMHMYRLDVDDLPFYKLSLITTGSAFGTAIINDRYIPTESITQHFTEGLAVLLLACQFGHGQAV